MKKHKVVVTGIGVVAPNGVGVDAFESALREGRSGIKFFEEAKELNFRCRIGGQPDLSDEHL
ncbi:MAG: beta-ketoacyl synthase N-terminal-like domain-containing protein, partial [Cyclobacteriaceae bacterium]